MCVLWLRTNVPELSVITCFSCVWVVEREVIGKGMRTLKATRASGWESVGDPCVARTDWARCIVVDLKNSGEGSFRGDEGPRLECRVCCSHVD